MGDRVKSAWEQNSDYDDVEMSEERFIPLSKVRSVALSISSSSVRINFQSNVCIVMGINLCVKSFCFARRSAKFCLVPLFESSSSKVRNSDFSFNSSPFLLRGTSGLPALTKHLHSVQNVKNQMKMLKNKSDH